MLRFTILFALATVSTSRAQDAEGQVLEEQITEEIARRVDATHTASGGPMVGSLKQNVIAETQRARQALNDGRVLLALRELRLDAETVGMMNGFAVYAGKPSWSQQAYQAEWDRASQEFTALGDASADGTLALARAFAQTTASQARVYFASSREYGLATDLSNGVVYLGAARADAQFAQWCLELAAAETLAAPSCRSISPELDDLAREVMRAYQPPASIEQHASFIVLNAAVKSARELNDAGAYYGALYEYLEALVRFGAIRPATAVGDPAQQLARLAKQCADHGRDHSIGRVFLEMAEQESRKAAGDATASGKINTLVYDVLPRYFAALEPRKASDSVAASVTITLVRWPYT